MVDFVAQNSVMVKIRLIKREDPCESGAVKSHCWHSNLPQNSLQSRFPVSMCPESTVLLFLSTFSSKLISAHVLVDWLTRWLDSVGLSVSVRIRLRRHAGRRGTKQPDIVTVLLCLVPRRTPPMYHVCPFGDLTTASQDATLLTLTIGVGRHMDALGSSKARTLVVGPHTRMSPSDWFRKVDQRH